jgi:hypothetical protein
MITKVLNKWMFTFSKYKCHSYALCLPYVKLTSYSAGHVQISNDAKLNMTDGAYKDPILDISKGFVGRGHGQVQCSNAPPPPPHPPVSLEQLLATQNNLMRRLVENDEHRGAER